MEKHYFFSGKEEPDEIKRILADNSDASDFMRYTRKLSKDELAERREQYGNVNIEIVDHNEVLTAAKEVHKLATKPLKDESVSLMKSIRSKHEEIEGKVYLVANQDAGIMDIVNEEGFIVESRRLKPEEKQARLFPVPKAVNQ